MDKMSNKVREFWKIHDQKILTVLALILTALVSFQAGKTSSKDQQTAKIDVSLNQLAANPEPNKVQTLGQTIEKKATQSQTSAKETSVSNKEAKPDSASGQEQPQNCALVASKNSTKYHLPTCHYAAKITEANRVCFSSKEEAEAKGYQPAKCCNK